MLGWLLLLSGAWAADLLWSADLESDDGGFSSTGTTYQWRWDEVLAGPGVSFDGTRCWATNPRRNYYNDSEDYLGLPALDLTAASQPLLLFQHWYAFEVGDQGVVEVDYGDGWQVLEPAYGYPSASGFEGMSEAWAPVYFDLTGVASLDQVRLTFSSDVAVAAAGWYVDNFLLYDGDVTPPRVSDLTVWEDTEDLQGPYLVQASISDDVAVVKATLRYMIDDGEPMDLDLWPDEVGYSASIPGQDPDTRISYQVFASDGFNEVLSPTGGLSFRVRLPAPTGLAASEENPWGDAVDLSWMPPDSEHTLLSYRVYRDGEWLQDTTAAACSASMLAGEQRYEVAAVFDVGEGDRSEALTVDGAVPTLWNLEPSSGYQGDSLRLKLTGQHLLLVAGDAQVDLGVGIRINAVDVRDVDTAWVLVDVVENAKPGVRSLDLQTDGVEVRLENGFTVMDGRDRPHLLSVEPDDLEQGDVETLTVTASQAFVALPTVTIGDIVVEEVRFQEGESTGQTILVDVAVPYSTPRGLHEITVDDGVRIYSGLDLQVRIAMSQLDQPCGCGGRRRPLQAAGWLSLLAGLCCVQRRRGGAWRLSGRL